MVNVKSKDIKSSSNKKKNEKVEVRIFDKELAKLPPELQKKLKAHEKNFKDTITIINKAAKKFAMGFYITPEIKVVNNVPTPNFDNITLNFLLDDFERPIPEFNPQLLLGKEFDKILSFEKKKDENGQEFVEYTLKKHKNIKFTGTSISHLRENCFDAVYDDLKTLGGSFVYEDSRGFISALKTIDIHRNMLLQKFEKYIVVYAGAGSWLRGEKSNDFDIFIVVDDTDVKRMPRMQVKDQLTRIVWQMAQEVAQFTGINLHAQVYLLTDFWDALKDAHPVMFTFLRDGVPFYDRGIYSAWKELLKLGKIKPSAEAIDMHMNVGTQLIDRAKKMFNEIVMNDIYNSVLSPSQAVLMLKGYNPTTPKETVKMFKEVLLAKEKCVSKKDVETLEKTVALFKKIEHNREYEVKGADVDVMIKDAELFLKNIKKMFEEITEEKTKESIISNYTGLLSEIRNLPGFADVKEDKVFAKVEKDLIKSGKIPSFVKSSLKSISKAKADYDKGKITATEVNKALKEVRNVLTEVREHRNKIMAQDFGRKRFLFNYDKDKLAEIINYEDKNYLLDLANNKGYELTGKSKEFLLEAESFSDNNKYGALKVDETLITLAKKLLKTKEIYL